MNHKYIVAVSGGVDSVVLLHHLWRLHPAQIVVAHFDHGIRDESSDDAQFVRELSRDYNLPCEVMREELGKGASEEIAREHRYAFLRRVAAAYNGTIVTAHHADDVVETIAINIQRGTGWRGLAVLDSSDLIRPLIHFTKQQIYDYADRYNLKWREDSTNASDKYLRNRLRYKLVDGISNDTRLQLRALRETQCALKRDIDNEVRAVLKSGAPYSRHFFSLIDDATASELLRGACIDCLGFSPHRLQRERALIAIKTMQAGKTHEVGDGVSLRFTKQSFSIQRT